MPDLPGSPPVPFSLPRAGTTAAPPGFPPDVAPNQLIASTHINAIRNSVAFWPGDVDGQNHILKNVVLQNVTGVLADPTTTKGDLIARGAAVLLRVGVGANGAVLTADSTQASGVKWTPFTAAPVASVFGRTGAVIAAPGDYTAAQVTNAVSTIGSYADPAWITSLNWSKIAAAPATFPPAVHTHDANAIVSGVMSPARLGTGVADQTVFLRGDGTWQVPGGPGGTVPATRVLTAGYGLTGGGSLAVDRSFAVVDDTNIQKIRVLAAGTVIAARSAVNLIQGSNVTISAVDDAANNRVNVTIASAGGGGTGGAVDSVFGRTGAVLAQNGDYNVSQITGALADPTTSKGDVLARTTAALARVAIGADGQVLTADSAQPTGVKWAAASGGVASVFGRTGAVVAVAGDYTAAQVTGAVVNPTSAKGDMMVRDNSAVQRLPAGTDGFVLTVDSAQALGVKWAAVAAGSAQTPWTSDIDGATFKLTNVSQIGIGTASPGALVEMASAASPSLKIRHTAGVITDAAEIRWATGPATDGTEVRAVTRFNVSSTTAGGDLSWWTAAGPGVALAERMRITAAGNVGIGTASPGALLDVAGSTVGSTQAILARGSDASFALMAKNGTGGGTNGSEMARFGLDYSGVGWNAGIRFLRGIGAADGFLALDAGGSARMWITAAGSVGIGIQSPADTLAIACIPWVANANGGIRLQTPGAEWTVRFAIKSDNAGTARAAFDFQGSEIAVITEIGLGVKKTTPVYPLDVIGDVNCTGAFRINGAAIGGAQSPWTGNIDGGGFNLSNVVKISGPTSGPNIGKVFIHCPPAGATTSPPVSTVFFSVQEGGNQLQVTVIYSTGVTKSALIGLS